MNIVLMGEGGLKKSRSYLKRAPYRVRQHFVLSLLLIWAINELFSEPEPVSPSLEGTDGSQGEDTPSIRFLSFVGYLPHQSGQDGVVQGRDLSTGLPLSLFKEERSAVSTVN